MFTILSYNERNKLFCALHFQKICFFRVCKSGCFFFFSLTFVGRVVFSNIFISGRFELLIRGLLGLLVTFVAGLLL